jgi:thiamine biosynthesis lipoprotein
MRVRVGFKKMRLDEKGHTVELLAPQMRLDLGSIAKGYACDEAVRVLKQKGFSVSLVAAGGDTVAGDAPPGRKGWRIEVGSLDVAGDTPKASPPVVEIANAAISTSGDRFQRLEIGGKRYSHILDPRTGQPLTDHNLVTVIAHDGLTAGISTACSVIGPEQGLKLVAEWKAAARMQRQHLAKVEITESPSWADWLMK